MTHRRMVGVAVTAALFGTAAGYVLGRQDTRSAPTDRPPRPATIKVTPLQVRAAQVAIKGRELLGEPIPPGLQRIANARRRTPEDDYRFYAQPENQVPEGRPRRRSSRAPD